VSEDTVVHELGYRHYDGPLGGRRQIRRSLLADGLRRAWLVGARRRGRVLLGILVALLVVPAVVFTVVGVVTGGLIQAPSVGAFLGSLQLVVVIVVALPAGRLLGEPFRYGVLPLYLTRPLGLADYLAGRLGALALSASLVAGVPAAILMTGALLRRDWSAWGAAAGPAVATVVVLGLQLSLLTAMFACFGTRTGWGTAMSAIYVVVTSGVTALVADRVGVDSWPAAWMAGLNPFSVASSLYVDHSAPQRAATFLVATVVSLVATSVIVRRHVKVS
jgi:ABC-2 type transport system permease protein